MRLTLILLCLLSLSNAYRKVLDKLIFLNDLNLKQQEQPKPTTLLEDDYDDNTTFVGPMLEMNVGAHQNSSGNNSSGAAFITDENR